MRNGAWTCQASPPMPTLLDLCLSLSAPEAGHTHHLHSWDHCFWGVLSTP